MTRRYYLNGAELTSVTVTGRPRQDELDGLTSSAFGGDIGTSGIIIDDPTGSVTINGLQPFYVDEDSCTPPRVWTGYIGARRIARGNLFEGRPVGRRYDCDLMDLNFLLGLRVLRDHADDKRPQETDAARVAWLMTTPAMTDAAVGIFDNGFVSSAVTHLYDEADLFSEFPDQSLNAIMAGSKTYFVYYDPAASAGEEASLFYGEHAVGFGNLSVKLSNVRADIDDSNPATQTTFSVHDEVQVLRDPQAVNDGLLYKFLGNQAIYRQLASTFATFGIHRDGVLSSDRVGKLATAEGQAAIYLAQHAAERDTITCTVRLKKNQINWFREGWRVQAKFSHLPGYTSFTYVMIEKRTVALAPRAFDTYDVTLELTSAAPLGNGPGGGDPGDFPHVGCSGAPDLIQSMTDTSGSFTQTFAPTPGKLLIASFAERVAGGLVTMAGFTLIDRATNFLGNHRSCSMWYRVVQVGDDAVWPWSGVAVGCLMEWNATGVDAHVRADDQNPGSGHMLCGGAITPPAGSAVTILGGAAIGEFDPVTYSVAPDAGVTELQDDHNVLVGSPYSWVGYKTATSASGAYSVGGIITESTSTGRNQYAGITVTLVCDASTNPPGPATWQRGEVPTPTPDGTTTTFTTLYPFADLSLVVYVDRLDQTAAVTSYDGAAGTFTLGFAPKVGELVEVDYQGR